MSRAKVITLSGVRTFSEEEVSSLTQIGSPIALFSYCASPAVNKVEGWLSKPFPWVDTETIPLSPIAAALSPLATHLGYDIGFSSGERIDGRF